MMESVKRKEQCERLSYVLIFRLVQKFGKKHLDKISFFVEELLNSRTNITAEDIDKLEKEVRQAVILRSARGVSNTGTAPEEDHSTSSQAQVSCSIASCEEESLQQSDNITMLPETLPLFYHF